MRRIIPSDPTQVTTSASAGDHAGANPGDVALVYFDLETTGLSLLNCEILQVAAKAGDKEFSEYILPQNDVPDDASKVNGLVKRDDHLYLWGQRVETTDAAQVIVTFVEFLKEVSEGKPVALIAHNGNRFDSFIIIRDMKRHNHLDSFFEAVVGFIDTLPVMRETLRGLETHKLEALAKHYGISTEGAHDALGDVRILEQIVNRARIPDSVLRSYMRSISQVALGGALPWAPHRKYGLLILTPSVSADLIRSLAQCKITLEVLQMASGNNAEFEDLVSNQVPTEEIRVLKRAVKESILKS